MNMDLAKRLVELRVYNNMTQDDLAAETGINKKDIEKWERGKDSPDGVQLIKLSQVYRIPIDEILLNFDTDSDYEEPETHEPVASANDAAVISDKKKSYNWYAFPYPIIVIAAYLLIGFSFNLWHPTWLVLLTIPVYYIALAMRDAKSFTQKAYIFPYPIVVIAAYLLIGFSFNLWHPTWLIFLTIPIYYITLAMNDAKGFTKKAYIFPYPIITVILYLAYGFDYNIWHPTWLVFLTIPVYYMAIAWLDSKN